MALSGLRATAEPTGRHHNGLKQENIMRILRLAAMIVGIMGAAIGLSAQKASATPLAGSLPAATATAGDNSLVSNVYYRRRFYYGRPAFRRVYYRPVYYRRYYRPRRVYYRRFYRPRVVCRIRYGYYGPRRVCFRRF